jgi:hypothetical protein
VLKRLALGVTAIVAIAVIASSTAVVSSAEARQSDKFYVDWFQQGRCANPGPLDGSTGNTFGIVSFKPEGEILLVEDWCTDGWSIVAELYWGGNQRRPKRTCWAVRSGSHTCDLNIPEGTRVWVYIAQARRKTCSKPSNPSLGCTKNRWSPAYGGRSVTA